jgi:hypothetical protein
MIKLAGLWGKIFGTDIELGSRKNDLVRIRKLQNRHYQAVSGSNKVTQFAHETKDEEAVFRLTNWMAYKWRVCTNKQKSEAGAGDEVDNEPVPYLVKGETFLPELLRTANPIDSRQLLDAFSQLGQMMQAGVDPLDASQEHDMMLSPEFSDGGIALSE